MIEYEEIERLSSVLIQNYEAMELKLVKNIAARIPYGDPNGSTLKWQLRKLSEMGALTQENIKTISAYSGKLSTEIESIVQKSGYTTLARDEKIYTEAFKQGLLRSIAVPLAASESVKQIMQASASTVKNALNLTNTTMIQSAQSTYLSAVNTAYLEVSSGLYDYNSSIRNAVKTLADKGISGTTYMRKDGVTVEYPVDAAVRRSVLTSVSQSANNLQLSRAEEWNAEYVEVTSHATARPDHALWQGKVYKLKGSDKEYENFYVATEYGTIRGLGGINCRHNFHPFFPGISEQTYKPYPKEVTDKAYAESQKQRQYENEIRKLKRECIAEEAAGDKEAFEKAAVKLKEKENQLSGFLEETGRGQTPRTGVVGFDKSISAKATAANNKVIAEEKAQAATAQKLVDEKRIKAYNKSGVAQAEAVNVVQPSPFAPLTKPTDSLLSQANALSVNQKTEATRYTGSAYGELNKGLRGEMQLRPIDKNTVDSLTSAINASKIDDNIIVWRGTYIDNFANASEMKSLPIGDWVNKTLTDKAFSSTSIYKERAFSGNVFMEILVPSGSHALYVAPISQYASEAELILQRGARFKILDAREIGNKKLITAILENGGDIL